MKTNIFILLMRGRTGSLKWKLVEKQWNESVDIPFVLDFFLIPRETNIQDSFRNKIGTKNWNIYAEWLYSLLLIHIFRLYLRWKFCKCFCFSKPHCMFWLKLEIYHIFQNLQGQFLRGVQLVLIQFSFP